MIVIFQSYHDFLMCVIGILLPIIRLRINLCLKVKKKKTESFISMIMKIVVAATDKPNNKPPPGDKSLGINTAIRFYDIEDGDNTEEV